MMEQIIVPLYTAACCEVAKAPSLMFLQICFPPLVGDSRNIIRHAFHAQVESDDHDYVARPSLI